MVGISFFGVTPGFSQKHLSRNHTEMNAVLSDCSHIFTLDQFSINIPSRGAVYVFGGQSTQHGHIRFIGLFRHAIEYGGNRGGGYGGAGIWLKNSWMSGERAAKLLDRMSSFLQDYLLDEDERFIKTFDQIDWSEADDFLDLLENGTMLVNNASSYRDPGQQPYKLLIKEQLTSNTTIRKDIATGVINYIGKSPDAIQDRIIYLSFDHRVIEATAQLGRIQSMSFDEFIRKRSHWVPSLGKATSAAKPNRMDYSEGSDSRVDFEPWEQEAPAHQPSGFEARYPPHRPSRYPLNEPSSSAESRNTPSEGRPFGQTKFKLASLLSAEYYYKLMIIYCFVGFNFIMLLIGVLSYIYFTKNDDSNGVLTSLRKSGEGTFTETIGPSANPPIEKAQPSRNGLDNATSPGSIEKLEPNTLSKSNTDLPCSRGQRSGKGAAIDQMVIETQIFSNITRNLETRIDKSIRTNDSKLSLTREEMEIAAKLFQRERSYARCLEQLQQDQAKQYTP